MTVPNGLYPMSVEAAAIRRQFQDGSPGESADVIRGNAPDLG